jgi:hypothetical protein
VNLVSCSKAPSLSINHLFLLILDDLTKRLINTHPEQAEVIIQKQQVIQNQWTDLTSKADLHKV